nr:hypothetical protein SHINE37_40173 [Rhizobiaceae bacterium]
MPEGGPSPGKPPSALPGISPFEGRDRQDAKDLLDQQCWRWARHRPIQSPPLRGRCPAGQRGVSRLRTMTVASNRRQLLVERPFQLVADARGGGQHLFGPDEIEHAEAADIGAEENVRRALFQLQRDDGAHGELGGAVEAVDAVGHAGRAGGRVADDVDADGDVRLAEEMIEGHRVPQAAVDHHPAVYHHRAEDGGQRGGGGDRRQERAAVADAFALRVIIRGDDLQGNGKPLEGLRQPFRQEGLEDALQVELADAEAAGDDLGKAGGPEAPEAVHDAARMADGGQRVLADLPARHAGRPCRAHDGADRRAGDQHRADAEFVQHLDDMDMGKPARAAAAKRDGDGRAVGLRLVCGNEGVGHGSGLRFVSAAPAKGSAGAIAVEMHARVAEGADLQQFVAIDDGRLNIGTLLEDRKGAADEPAAAGCRVERPLAEALGIGRIGEEQVERLHRADAAERRRIAPEDLRAADHAERLDVGMQEPPALDALFDEEHRARAARQRLQADGAGAGEEIEHARAVERFGIGVREDVEQAFARAVGRRADVVRLRRRQRPAAEFTADDAHGRLLPLAARAAAACRTATTGLAARRPPARLAAEGFAAGFSAERLAAIAARRAVPEGPFALCAGFAIPEGTLPFRARLAVATGRAVTEGALALCARPAIAARRAVTEITGRAVVAGAGALAAETAAALITTIAGFRRAGADPLAILVTRLQDARLFRPVVAGTAAGRALAVRVELLRRTRQRAIGGAAVALGLRRAFGALARLALHALGGFRLLLGNGTGAGRHPDIRLAGAHGRFALRLAVETVLVAATAAALRLVGKAVVAPGVEAGARLLAAVLRLLAPAGRLFAPGRSLATALRRRLLVRVDRCMVEQRRVEIRLGFLDEARAELVAQRAAADLLGMAFRQFAELERAVGDADQAVHVEAERAEHVLDLAVLAFAKPQRQPDIGALRLVERRIDRAVEHAVDGDALLQLVEIGLLDLAVGAHAVAPQPAGGRQLQHAREAAVIGQEQEAFGVDVEAADGHDARQVLGQVLENGRAALGVGIGRHQAGRLVVEPEARALDAADRHAVHFDMIGKRGVEHGRVQHRAVHADPALHDHALDIAARGDAGARQELGDALRRQLGAGGCGGRRLGGTGGLAVARGGLARERLLGVRRLAGGKGLLARCGRCAARLVITARGLGARPFWLVFGCHLCCLRFAVSYQVRRPGLRGIRAAHDKSLHGDRA